MKVATLLFYAVASLFLGVLADAAVGPIALLTGETKPLYSIAQAAAIVAPIAFLILAGAQGLAEIGRKVGPEADEPAPPALAWVALLAISVLLVWVFVAGPRLP